MKTMIFIQPIGQVDAEVLSYLSHALNPIWPAQMLNPVDIPKDAYDEVRGQYDGMALLNILPDKEGAVLGVTDVDIYAECLNFLFGLACGSKALISLKRLRPEFYGMPEDTNLFKHRAQKEAVHELGHVFGLEHCPDKRCVMHFSNSIWDTDFKGWTFCRSCERELQR
jgi:archaemetzincin